MEMFAMMMRIPGCIPIYMFEDVYVRSTEVNFSDESENVDPRTFDPNLGARNCFHSVPTRILYRIRYYWRSWDINPRNPASISNICLLHRL